MRDLLGVNQGDNLAIPGVHHRYLVGLVGRCHKVAMGGIPAAVMQEARRVQAGHGECIQVAVVHQQDLAGFLDVDDKLRVLMRGHDSRHTGLRVVFLGIHSHAAGRLDPDRLQGVAVHQHVLGGPVGAGDGDLVFETLVLGGFNRATFQADLDLGHHLGRFHVQVYHIHLGVAADGEHVAAGVRGAGNMHRVAGFEN